MKIMKYEEMKERIVGVEDFQEIEIGDNNISVYDSYEDRHLNFRNLKSINLKDLFQFNTLQVNKEKFFNTINRLDKNMFMLVDKVIFINSVEEVYELLEEYDSQCFDEGKVIGINFYRDNVIVINALLIKELALEDEEIFSLEFHRGIWQTLIHELRHNITYNPIVKECEITIEEGSEELVEAYCLKIYDKDIIDYEDSFCF